MNSFFVNTTMTVDQKLYKGGNKIKFDKQKMKT
jgi:hypothetical protein